MAKKSIKVTQGQATFLRTAHGILSFLLAPLMAFYDAYLVWPTRSERKGSFRPKVEYVHLAGGIASLLTTITLVSLFVLAIGAPGIPAIAALSGLVISIGVFPPAAMAFVVVLLAAIVARALISWITAEIFVMPVVKETVKAVGSAGKLSVAKVRGGIILAGLIGANLKNNLEVPEAKQQPIEMTDRSAKKESRPLLAGDRAQKQNLTKAASHATAAFSSQAKQGSTAQLLAALDQGEAGPTHGKKDLYRYLVSLDSQLDQEEARNYSLCSDKQRAETSDTLERTSSQIATFITNFPKEKDMAYKEDPAYLELEQMQERVLVLSEKIKALEPVTAQAAADKNTNNSDLEAEQQDSVRPRSSMGG